MDRCKDAASLTNNTEALADYSQMGIMDRMCRQIRQGDGRLGGDVGRCGKYAENKKLEEINIQLVQRNAKAVVDQLLEGRKCSSREADNLESRQFSDALKILNLNRSLFLQTLQLAQNQESIRLFQDAILSESRGTSNSETSAVPGTINKKGEENHSRKKTNDRYTYPSKRSSKPQVSDEIVVLRPAPMVMETPEHVKCSCSSLHSHQLFKNKEPKGKPTFFSFKEIKKRLRRALADNQEKRHWISSVGFASRHPSRKLIEAGGGDKESHGLSIKSLPNSSADIKRRDKSHKKTDLESRNSPEISATGSYYKDHEADIFEEAKKHLSERLRNLNTSLIIENRQKPRTLGRILFAPEHDLSSPLSPNRILDNGSVSTKSRLPPRSSMKDDQESDDDSKILKTNDIGIQDALKAFEVPSEPVRADITQARHSPDTRKSCEGNGTHSSILASPSRDQVIRSSFDVSPSSSSVCSPQKVYNIKDEEEHQSPISVLEPLFIEDASSPNNSAKGSLRPHRIDFNDYGLVPPRDLKIERNHCMNEDEEIYAYVRSVLQTAALSWNEILLTRPSPDQILHTPFSNGEQSFQTESDHDPKLLFDCVIDVLLEVYRQHFGCSPWTAYLNPNTRPFPLEDHFVNRVGKDVKSLILPEFASPTLDQLVGQDIAKSRSWLDIRLDTEEILNQIAEDFLEESVVDTTLMFFS